MNAFITLSRNEEISVDVDSDPRAAYFRQVKDPTIRRGYYQKSVILLSYLPLVSFFTQIATLVANKFFENGDLPLEIFCHDVDRWPSPNPGNPAR